MVFPNIILIFAPVYVAGVLKLVDKPDLGSGAVRRVGSSPTTCTERKEPARSVILLKRAGSFFFLYLVQPWLRSELHPIADVREGQCSELIHNLVGLQVDGATSHRHVGDDEVAIQVARSAYSLRIYQHCNSNYRFP